MTQKGETYLVFVVRQIQVNYLCPKAKIRQTRMCKQNSPDSLPAQFILHVREHENHTKVMDGGGVMLTGRGVIFA